MRVIIFPAAFIEYIAAVIEVSNSQWSEEDMVFVMSPSPDKTREDSKTRTHKAIDIETTECES